MQILSPLLALILLSAPAACHGNGATSAGDDAQPGASKDTQPLPQAQAQPRPAGRPQPKLPVGRVVLETPPRAPLTLQVEVASTDQQRQMGMMFRESLGELEGMLFTFPEEMPLSFWMRNTLIPLDMLFIDADWKVVGIVERAEPLTDDPRGVPTPSQYVLEVNGGFVQRHGLGVGTQVRYTPPAECDP